MKKILSTVILSISIIACNPGKESAEQHIQNAIEYHGGKSYADISTAFKFRDKSYKLNHDKGSFKYERIFTDSAGQKINDVLDNKGFKRMINGQKVKLSSKDSAAYANSVNSVHYFALLPYNLQDEAVIADNKEDVLINGKAYKTVEVRFKQEGGGTDFDDVFMFWFNSKTYEMDYFAYSCHTDGGGVRFRESINFEKVDGVIFRDYNNYKAELETELIDLPRMFEKGELELLSTIDLEFEGLDL